MDAAARRVPVGRIVGVFGVRGEVKLESWTEPREKIFDYQPWQLESAPGEIIEVGAIKGRRQGKGLVAQWPGLENRDMAAGFIGCQILVSRERLPEPETGEYYWTDLEHLQVSTLDGRSLGRVSHVFATGANDVLVVRDEDRERLIPFLKEQVVREVDLQTGRITVDWDPEF